MQYVVTPFKEVDFGATGIKEIIQNVSFILSTVIFSCPLDREFGITPDLDSPVTIAQATNAANIIQAIQEYEPRAIVDEVLFEGNALDGQLKPIVRITIDEGGEVNGGKV
jgi:uncharacterized protein